MSTRILRHFFSTGLGTAPWRPLVIVLALLLAAPGAASAQETDTDGDPRVDISTGIGWARNQGGLIGDGENGIAWHLAASGAWPVSNALYVGARLELEVRGHGQVLGVPDSSLLAVTFAVGPQIEFGDRQAPVVPYLFGTLGFTRWTAEAGGISADTEGAALGGGGGLRVMLGENIHIGPEFAAFKDFSDEGALNLRATLTFGVSL